MQAFVQTTKASSNSTQTTRSVSGLAMKSGCENGLILAKVREELQEEIAVLQKKIRIILGTKFSQHLNIVIMDAQYISTVSVSG